MSYYRRRRIRRLSILFLGFLAFCALGAQLYRVGLRRSRAMTEAMRQQAVISYSHADYPDAVVQFAQYFEKSHAQDTDPTAMFAYAEARVRVPEDRSQHVYDAIQLFERYLASKDNNPQHRAEARRQLLTLYVKAWYSDEAIRLADTILQTEPRDAEALKCKVQALDEKKDERGALEACRQFNAADPQNFWGQRVTVYLMKQCGASNEDLIHYASSLQKAHPSDPMFEMVLGVAYDLAGDAKGKQKWLAAAASHTPTDPELVSDLADRLDRSDLFADADGLIRRADKLNPCPALDRMLVKRLWEDGDAAAVLDRTERLDPRAPAADGDLLIYRTLALQDTGRTAEAESLAKTFTSRKDPVALTWAPVLTALRSNDSRGESRKLTPLQRATLLRTAIASDPQNGIFRYMLAEAYSDMDENEPALGELKQAVMLEPAWAAPHMLGAQIFGRTGRFDYALDSTIAAEKRRPDDKATRIAHALALYHFAVANGRTDLYKPLLAQVEQFEKQRHDPALIPAWIDLLNGTGQHEAAIQAAQEACHRTPPLPADILLQIAYVSEGDSLGQEQALRTEAVKTHGLGPQIAMAEARALHQSGQDQKGLELLIDAAKAHTANSKAWRLAIAQYRELMGDLNALRDFELLGNEYPHDLDVQRAVLASRSRTRDREFWQQSIDRLKALTGAEGIEWRAERARLILDGDWSDTDRDEAMKLLNEVAAASTALPEPHRLLAVAYQKNKDIPRAFGEYQAAYNLRPADPLYATALVQFLLDNHRDDEAVGYLDRFCRAARLSNSTREWAARAYAQAGKSQKAVALIRGEPPSPTRDALLVEIGGDQPHPAASSIPAVNNARSSIRE